MIDVEKPSHQLAFLIAVCAFVFFLDLGGRDIWDIDEGMHAAMAQVMLSTGDWVTPVFNGEAFFDKPPLVNWLTAVSFLLFGITEFAARLPSALAGFGTVLLTYSLARRIYGPATAIYAGLILATSFEFIVLSKVVQYDIPFAFFVTLAIWCYAFSILDERRAFRYLLGFYASVGLAVLTKGPIGAVLPGIAIVGHIAISRDWRRIWATLLPAGIALFAIVVVPWFVLMEQANPGYLEYFIVKQHFGNFLGGEGAMQPRHPEPFYYYVPVLIAGLLPWGLLLPQAVVKYVRSDLSKHQSIGILLLAWLLGVFLFFSVATSKLATYLLPIFPAAAIVVAHYWNQAVTADSFAARRSLLIVAGILFAILVAALGYVWSDSPWTLWETRYGVGRATFDGFMAVLIGSFAVLFGVVYYSRKVAVFAVLCLISPLANLYMSYLMMPGVDPYRGAREISLVVDQWLPEGEALRVHGRLLDSAAFYTSRKIELLYTEEELYDFLSSPERRYVVLRHRARIAGEAFAGEYHVVQVIGNKAIVSNQPGPADAQP